MTGSKNYDKTKKKLGSPWGAQGHGAPWRAQGHGPQGPMGLKDPWASMTHGPQGSGAPWGTL